MHKKYLLPLSLALIAIILAMALNPSGDKHRNAIRAAVAERSPIAGALGVGVLTALVVEYHSLGIASYTLMDGQRVSIGAFGYVYVIQAQAEKKL